MKKCRCEWGRGDSCQADAEYQTVVWPIPWRPDPDYGPIYRAVCEEHAKWTWNNNVRAGHGVECRKLDWPDIWAANERIRAYSESRG